MKPLLPTALFLLACYLYSASYAAQVFKWVDDAGSAHFSDDLERVPSKYRDQVEEKSYKQKNRSGAKAPSASSEAKSGRLGKARERKLKRFSVRYTPYEGAASRIIVQVKFNNSVTARMAFDTGAPGLIISPKLAGRLNLYNKNDGMLETRAGGIGGSIPATRTIIDSVQVGGARAQFVPTTIAGSISGAFEGLLGMVFVDNYSVNIDTMNHVIIFSQLPPRANMPGGHSERWWRVNFHEFAAYRTAWKRFLDSLKNKSGGSGIAEQRKKAMGQYKEADKLFRKLERYASDNSTPMHWRKY
ncbi:hypothetical protein MNBD_NITROSPINAE03-1913 [hydrothermal vent metagenome]|uniref:DUF4124 domain-containing protein n=1 Tax=hydrothermal vent metagenome TaxID=652676 RepID=A0A3B1BU69_9ZZZZ